MEMGEEKVEEHSAVKEEMEEVVEVEIADPLGLDGDHEASRFPNEANEHTAATLAETVIEGGRVENVTAVEILVARSAEIGPRQQVAKSLAMGRKQVVISLEQSEASREVLVEEEEEQMDKEEKTVSNSMNNSSETRDKESDNREELFSEDIKSVARGKKLNKSHRFNKINTKEISKYNLSTTLEKSISKKHSLSLSLRKAVLEKLEKQKELLALREAQKRKSESEHMKVVNVTDTDLVDGPSNAGPEDLKEKIEKNSVSDLKDNKQSDAIKVITKANPEPKVDLKGLIKSLVTTKTPDSETIKKIVSKTRLDLRNREEADANEKRRAELEKSEEEKIDKKKKCRYCKDDGWGEVIGCDFCSSSYHPVCLNLGPPELKLVLALSHWKCPECIKGAKEATSSTRVTSLKSLQDLENISKMENLKRRAETSRVEVKVARLKLSTKEKGREEEERAEKGNAKDLIEDQGEEKLEMQAKGRQGLQEQVR